MGKSTISMVIFNSYVSLPEGTHLDCRASWLSGDFPYIPILLTEGIAKKYRCPLVTSHHINIMVESRYFWTMPISCVDGDLSRCVLNELPFHPNDSWKKTLFFSWLNPKFDEGTAYSHSFQNLVLHFKTLSFYGAKPSICS